MPQLGNAGYSSALFSSQSLFQGSYNYNVHSTLRGLTSRYPQRFLTVIMVSSILSTLEKYGLDNPLLPPRLRRWHIITKLALISFVVGYFVYGIWKIYNTPPLIKTELRRPQEFVIPDVIFCYNLGQQNSSLVTPLSELTPRCLGTTYNPAETTAENIIQDLSRFIQPVSSPEDFSVLGNDNAFLCHRFYNRPSFKFTTSNVGPAVDGAGYLLAVGCGYDYNPTNAITASSELLAYYAVDQGQSPFGLQELMTGPIQANNTQTVHAIKSNYVPLDMTIEDQSTRLLDFTIIATTGMNAPISPAGLILNTDPAESPTGRKASMTTSTFVQFLAGNRLHTYPNIYQTRVDTEVRAFNWDNIPNWIGGFATIALGIFTLLFGQGRSDPFGVMQRTVYASEMRAQLAKTHPELVEASTAKGDKGPETVESLTTRLIALEKMLRDFYHEPLPDLQTRTANAPVHKRGGAIEVIHV
ncbi:hypothetical protein DFJ77DRAFT_321741 [Powellomyces hirtus]|nr:hypothetical protein DFJ77DRAFT_321741 [Powellomyces hirtus]